MKHRIRRKRERQPAFRHVCAGIEPLESRLALSVTVLKDVNPGVAGSNPQWVGPLGVYVEAGGKVYFNADDGAHGREVWRTDGTESGTVLVKDIVPGVDGADPNRFVVVGDLLYFSVRNGDKSQLWRTDGTEAGTVMLSEMLGRLAEPTNVAGSLYFFVELDAHLIGNSPPGLQLWKSDGTTAGTSLVTDLPQDTASVGVGGGPVSIDDTLYFAIKDQANGMGLWKSDGTPQGTVAVKGFGPVRVSNSIAMANVDGVLFLAIDLGAGQSELWTSDGSEAGTELVHKFNRPIGELLAHDGALYFTARFWLEASPYPGQTFSGELWISDGTAEGTIQLAKNISPRDLTEFQGAVFFTAGPQLWRTNGTPAGTSVIADVGVYSNISSRPVVLNDAMYFVVTIHNDATDWLGARTLWKSDGTAAGTLAAYGPVSINPAGGNLDNVAAVGDVLYLTMFDAAAGAEPGIYRPSAWQNLKLAEDVDGNGQVSPRDAPRLIDAINTQGAGPLPDSMPADLPPVYLDVNGDGSLSPADVLLVINYLNTQVAQSAHAQSTAASSITSISTASVGAPLSLAAAVDSSHAAARDQFFGDANASASSVVADRTTDCASIQPAIRGELNAVANTAAPSLAEARPSQAAKADDFFDRMLAESDF